MNLRNWTFSLEKIKDVNIASVTIRETNGKDEANARLLAQAKGKDGNFMIEMIRLSIAKVDGVPVTQPYAAFDEWNTRTRNFVGKAYERVNGTSDEEVPVFLSTAVLDS